MSYSLSVDQRSAVVYLRLGSGGEVTRTEALSEDVIVDYDEEEVIGVEVILPWESCEATVTDTDGGILITLGDSAHR